MVVLVEGSDGKCGCWAVVLERCITFVCCCGFVWCLVILILEVK